MKNPILSLITVFTVTAALLATTSCTDELVPGSSLSTSAFTPKGTLVYAYLNLSVSGLSVTTATRDVVEDNEEERTINNLWVFQYDAESTSDTYNQLIAAPQYVTISEQTELTNVPVTLSDNDNTPSLIYVVTNTDKNDWTTYPYTGFTTVSELEAEAIPTPRPQQFKYNYETKTYDPDGDGNLSIPMSGSKEETVMNGITITVDVQRMYAKLCISVDLSQFNTEDYDDATIYNVTVGNIPVYCRVGTLFTDEDTPGDYSKCDDGWITRSFNDNEKSDDDGETVKIYPYVIYVPESIQGVNGTSDDKSENVPSARYSKTLDTEALSVTVSIYAITKDDVKTGPYSFTAYPGGDDKTNFNVKRNCVYYLTMTIYNLNEYDLVQPSANCIVCLSGETTSFYPYYRPEEGGYYKFIDYLNYNYGVNAVPDKRIDKVKIIWQSENSAGTGGYIGNNSNGTLVRIDEAPTSEDDDENTQEEYKRKIYVTIPDGEVGNALIGAYNSDNKLIWSWHIWSRLPADDPSNEANGVFYYTYDWDSSGIHYDRDRKPGYTVMNCNLGALADTPKSGGNGTDTFGTLYQWGRKDPFPPSKNVVNDYAQAYNSSNVGNYYDNSGSTTVTMTETTDEDYLFHSVKGDDRLTIIGSTIDKYIDYSILNPTVFICGTRKAAQSVGENPNAKNNYLNSTYYPDPQDGNWIYDSSTDHYNRLWGGLDPELDSNKITEEYNTNLTDAQGNYIHMYNDYGDDKSIFDPCPYGWRVSPPDLWLGFTNNGLNPTAWANVNYESYDSDTHGFYMYMDGWRDAAQSTSFFPCQATRIPDGTCWRVGTCGNYENATADMNDRVNILHLHYSLTYFHIFEQTWVYYYIKSTAGSVRCVKYTSVSN